MSPDDVFAAQMWPWPDPVIKRDSRGHVLFINAAFLSLYGGRVETWTGQPVMGWPAPNPQGQTYRFETRAGAAPHEVVYDWVETMMADGNALAIARDVTAYQPPAQTQPVQETQTAAVTPPALNFEAPPPPPLAAHNQIEPAAPELEMPAATPEFIAQPQQLETDVPPATSAALHGAPAMPAFEEPALPAVEDIAPQAYEEAPQAAEVPVNPALQPAAAIEVPEPLAPPAQEQMEAFEAAQQDEPAPHAQAESVEGPQAADPEPAPIPEPATRDFERRALPIENEDAVLGSNWRDAVIARAVGSAVTPADAAEPEPAKVPDMPATNKGAAPLKILLAEDNAINALLTRTLLEADGCVVETVEDGALAVDAVKKNTYDLILMDMRMPNMDGLEATRKIRAMGGSRADNLPIIALTANAFDDDRNACFDSGMNDFMTKPVSAEELTAMVTQWVEKTRAPADAAMAG